MNIFKKYYHIYKFVKMNGLSALRCELERSAQLSPEEKQREVEELRAQIETAKQELKTQKNIKKNSKFQ